MQTGGVRERLSSPNLPFCGRVPPSPSLPLMPRRGTSFSPKMRKGSKRIIWAGRLTRQAKSSCKQACGCISMAVRVAFLTRRSGIEKQPVPSRCYYFPTQAAYAGEKPAHRCQLSRGLGVDTVHPGCLRGRKGSALMMLSRGLGVDTVHLVRECRSRWKQGPGTNPSGAGKR